MHVFRLWNALHFQFWPGETWNRAPLVIGIADVLYFRTPFMSLEIENCFLYDLNLVLGSRNGCALVVDVQYFNLLCLASYMYTFVCTEQYLERQ